MAIAIRNLRAEDYPRVIAVLDEWFGGRPMTAMLSRLFFEHFGETSFAAEGLGGALAGFLCGFLSPSRPGEAFVHFVGVDPDHRREGVGRRLYERFFEEVAAEGCGTVECITSPANVASIAFHRRLGFEAQPGTAVTEDGVPYVPNYSVGQPRVVLRKALSLTPAGDRASRRLRARAHTRVIMDALDAIERRDAPRVAELFDPEVELHWPTALPYGGTFRGLSRPGPTWEDTWTSLQPTEADRRMDPRVIGAGGDEVVVLWHQRGRRPTGERLDTEVLGLYEVSRGKIRRAQMFYFDPGRVVDFLSRTSASAPDSSAQARGDEQQTHPDQGGGL
jgi:GNAT superfamily N-acetyltransferase/ketosteroid isomerase-like protein